MFRLLLYISLLAPFTFFGCGAVSTDDNPQPTEVDLSTLYGAEANPTGSPIGGGAGYQQIVTEGDFSVTDKASLLSALQNATAGQVIYLESEVEIDLTGERDLYIPEQVTLAGNRGQDGSAGPLLFADDMDQGSILFWARAGVRVSGIRFRGPAPNFVDITAAYEGKSTKCLIASDPDIEVDNCEFSNFNRGAVEIYPDGQRIHIHHNFFHDVHAYPVIALDRSATPILIEANIIHWIWHATAGSGYPGTGYEARYNRIIRKPVPQFWLPYDESHAIDMHPYLQVLRDRGQRIAGDLLSVHHNTFIDEASGDPSVLTSLDAKVRGTPRILAEFYNNQFLNVRPEQAVVHYDGNVWVYNNQYGSEKIIVDIATETTPQILFNSPPPPHIDVPLLDIADVPIEVEVNAFEGLTIAMVRIELNDKVIYEGEAVPSPGELFISLSDLTSDVEQHKLTVFATDNRGIEGVHSTYFKL